MKFSQLNSDLNVSMEIGPMRSEKSFSVAWLKWPRAPACKLLWSLKSVYKEHGFNQFQGEAWRWTFSGLPRWRRVLDGLGFRQHLVPSVKCEASF